VLARTPSGAWTKNVERAAIPVAVPIITAVVAAATAATVATAAVATAPATAVAAAAAAAAAAVATAAAAAAASRIAIVLDHALAGDFRRAVLATAVVVLDLELDLGALLQRVAAHDGRDVAEDVLVALVRLDEPEAALVPAASGPGLEAGAAAAATTTTTAVAAAAAIIGPRAAAAAAARAAAAAAAPARVPAKSSRAKTEAKTGARQREVQRETPARRAEEMKTDTGRGCTVRRLCRRRTSLLLFFFCFLCGEAASGRARARGTEEIDRERDSRALLALFRRKHEGERREKRARFCPCISLPLQGSPQQNDRQKRHE
jgi:hypothetical protein